MKPTGGGQSAADKLAILERRRRVAAAYLRGTPQYEIARQEGLDKSQISRDLAAVRQEWKLAAIRDFDEHKAEQLAKIDAVEETAWQAWDRSRSDAETLHAGTTRGRTGKDGSPLPDLV